MKCWVEGGGVYSATLCFSKGQACSTRHPQEVLMENSGVEFSGVQISSTLRVFLLNVAFSCWERNGFSQGRYFACKLCPL